MNVPDELRYTRTHEWVRLDGGIATVGVTDYAQAELGDVVFVDLPAVGTHLEAGQVFGSVDSVKAAADLFSPVAGDVVQVNTALAQQTELVNADPYGEGWMIRVKTPSAALDQLLTAEEYRRFVEESSE